MSYKLAPSIPRITIASKLPGLTTEPAPLRPCPITKVHADVRRSRQCPKMSRNVSPEKDVSYPAADIRTQARAVSHGMTHFDPF